MHAVARHRAVGKALAAHYTVRITRRPSDCQVDGMLRAVILKHALQALVHVLHGVIGCYNGSEMSILLSPCQTAERDTKRLSKVLTSYTGITL